MILFLLTIICAFEPSCFTLEEPLELPEIESIEAPCGIPVLCHHHVGESYGYYSVSVSEFLYQLEILYETGFYLISPDDLLNGLQMVPDDKHPVLLTFDDGWEDNFRLLNSPDGNLYIDPDCVLGLVEEFCNSHPDFGRSVTFFISWDKVPFGQSEYVTEKFHMLLDMGYSLGNHTDRHQDYRLLPLENWNRSTIRPLEKMHRTLGIRTPEINALAYPGGGFPDTRRSWQTLGSFRFHGRKAVRLGFLVNGAIARMDDITETNSGSYYINRIEMSEYSIHRIVNSSILIDFSEGRNSIHDPLRYHPLSLLEEVTPR